MPVDIDIWDAYNTMLRSADIGRLQKLLARYELFKMTTNLPGDVVECGVFKGTGLFTWLKFLELHCPHSAKQLVGFDLFGDTRQRVAAALNGNELDVAEMEALCDEAEFDGVDTAELMAMALKISTGAAERLTLVDGDITNTALQFTETKPGFRISLLHLDLDVGPPTLAALKALWPRVVKGGIVVFDEYAVHKWSESEAVDEFFKDKDVSIRTLPFASSPTAYIVK